MYLWLIYLWLQQRKYFTGFWWICWKLCCSLGKGRFCWSRRMTQSLPGGGNTAIAYLGRLLWSSVLWGKRPDKVRQYLQPLSSSSGTESFHAFSSYFGPHSGAVTSCWSSQIKTFPPVSILSLPASARLWTPGPREQDGLVLKAPTLTLSKLSSTHLHYVNGSVNQTYYHSPLVFKLRKGKQLL